MTVGQPIYTEPQRRAVEHAKISRELPATAIVDLAKRGELEDLDGTPLEPFEIKKDSVYSIATAARKRRSRAKASDLVRKPHAEAMTELYARMMEVADRETERMAKEARRKPNQPIDAEHARKTARFVRELASLPAPGERGKKPGTMVAGERTEHGTKDKAALAIFKAAAGTPIEPAPAGLPQNQPTTQGEGAPEQRPIGTQWDGEREQREGVDEDEETPGSRARSAINSLLVQSVTSPEQG